MCKNNIYTIVNSIVIIAIIAVCCTDDVPVSVYESKYLYNVPHYDKIQVEQSSDTVHFQLDDTTYNTIESLNYFVDKGTQYVSLFDEKSASLNFYRLSGGQRTKRFLLRKFLPTGKMDKVTVYVQNFDSIFIADKVNFYLFDSAGQLKHSFSLLPLPMSRIKVTLDNSHPPIVIGNKIFATVRPSGTINSLAENRKWKVLYDFDITTKSSNLQYNLPETYQHNLYCFKYLYHSYCYNRNHQFVISFAADTNIYETDLAGWHTAYYGKSRYQQGNTGSITAKEIKENTSKSYYTHTTYEAIYYDEYNNRYLRVSKQKMSGADYDAKKRNRKQSLIIFDAQLRVIGESVIDETVDLNQLFVTGDGMIYARVNRRDEYGVHFVQFRYDASSELTKN